MGDLHAKVERYIAVSKEKLGTHLKKWDPMIHFNFILFYFIFVLMKTKVYL